MTHRERLIDLRNTVANEETHLDMTAWAKNKSGNDIDRVTKARGCGTPMCMAGHAAHKAWLAGEVTSGYIEYVASKWLGLDYAQAFDLFRSGSTLYGGTCQKPEALARLDALIAECDQ